MPERDLVTGVLQLTNLLIRRLAPILEKSQVTPQQWVVLLTLAEQETSTTSVALARLLSVTKQNMTGMVARLEQLGMIDREGDPSDLRAFQVRLSRKGRNLVTRYRPAYDQWIRELGGEDLSERDLQTLTRSVERLIERLDSQRLG